jgi:hypothetical protein
MRYDANCKEPMVEKYPTLKGITDDDKLLRVVIWMISEDSPFLLADREDYASRLTKVLKHVGAEYPRIAEGENKEYNAVATGLFMMMDNLVYVAWQSKLINFHQLTMFLRSPLNLDDPEKSIKQRLDIEKYLPDMHKSLVEYERQIFPDTHTRKVVKKETARLLQFAEKFSDVKGVI